MGFFDKLADKAKEFAEEAKKSAGNALENTSKVTQNLSEKATKTTLKFSEKASNEFQGISKKVVEEGTLLYGKASESLLEFSGNIGTSAKELSSWAQGMPDKLKSMAEDFDAEALWDKLGKTASKAGQELIVMVLTIYYAIESKIPGHKEKRNEPT